MRICIIGAGYVGPVPGACLVKQGHEVIFVDNDKKKLSLFDKHCSPVCEPELDRILQQVDVETTTGSSCAVKTPK